jgi:hypothetical protein
MADLEKIIRPHLPANIAPSNTASRCQAAPASTVAKFNQQTSAGGLTPTSVTSQWSFAYKKYMTKQEKEIAR